MEEKLWLRPENETPFEFHRDSTIDEREKRIFENRKTICSYAVKEGLDSIKSVEDADMLLTGINAMAVENPEARKQIPPFKTLEQEQISFVNNYLTAQKLFFEKVDKEPYIYPELLQMVHACLTRDNLDLADYEKGRYRNQYSGIIQIGYFEPTKGEKVGYEMNKALSSYAYYDGKSDGTLFERAAMLHAQMIRIQPFMDGNKRMAGLTTNALFRLHGLPVVDLCKNEEESLAYNNAVKTAIVKRDVTPLASIFMTKVLDGQNKIIDTIAIKEMEKVVESQDTTEKENKGDQK